MSIGTLTVVNNVTGQMVGGRAQTAKQGSPSSDFAEGYDLTITGYCLGIDGALATASIVKFYDDDTHTPLDPVYWHIWADGNCYIQLVGATSNLILPVKALVPQIFYGHTLLCAASTTDIAGGAEPTLEDIDHAVLGNYSGASISYAVSIFY